MKLLSPDPPDLQPYIQYRFLIPAIEKATKTMVVDGKEIKYIDPDLLVADLYRYIQVDYS